MKKLISFVAILVICMIAISYSYWPYEQDNEHDWQAYTDTFAVVNSTVDTSTTYLIAYAEQITSTFNLTVTGGDSCKVQVVADVSIDENVWTRIDSVTCTKSTSTAVSTYKDWSAKLKLFPYVRFITMELMAATDSGAVGTDHFFKE